MAKNAGKTVTLNRLIEEAAEENLILGITSTGRDGEKVDILTMTEKPVIYVPQGTIIATATETLTNSEVKLEILEITEYTTPLGRILIGKAVNGGLVEIAGPETNRQIHAIANKMLGYGAALIIVDGAINRKASAAPTVTEATILATGAVLSRNVKKVMEETLHQVGLFNLKPLMDSNIRSIASELLNQKEYGVIDREGNIEIIPITTALNAGRIIGGAIKENTQYVIISGSLVKKTLTDIISVAEHYQGVTFVIRDATRVFIEAKDWSFFIKRGVEIRVLDKINTLAVTTNPFSPDGYSFGAKEFYEKMKEILNPIPVIDVMLEEDGSE